ncbi:MAG TPA: L,D-transpeptidase family protein [Solirubrobacteraceae bacterium]|nr:L,D-transpeptidase family protein [Solirubrobacteraceae bacterium]
MGDEEQVGRGARPRRWLLFAPIALIPAIPVIIGIVLGMGQPDAGTPAANTAVNLTPVPSRPSAPAKPRISTALPVAPGPGAIVAILLHSTALRAAPHGRRVARLTTKTQFGSRETMLVVRHVPGWLGVVATQTGNGKVGWIPLSAASLVRVNWELKVSLKARRLTVLRGGKVLKRYTVAIGQPAAPTPTGRFAVTDRLTTGNPSGPYGCCILALSAHSPHAIQGWQGGDRIAIHSTPEVSSIGEAVSHGCLRLTLAEGRWLLGHVPLGTPTLISA